MHPITLSPIETALRLGLALVLGSLVGLERERGDRAAGLRTHALVCLGSALFMLVSAYGLTDLAVNPQIKLDPTRIAAQVVSGIGFLGAGTIIFRREIVRGLTTAAGLWVVAGIGLAVGAGMYLPAFLSTLGSLVILAMFRPLEAWLFRRPQRITLHVRPAAGQLAAIRTASEGAGTKLRKMTLDAGSAAGEEVVALEYLPAPLSRIELLIEQLRTIPGLVAIDHVTLIAGSDMDENTVDDLESAPEESIAARRLR
ncbi:MAG: MgtC/SapB family protein [Chloroflexota bacterium]